jgi:GNAT superfamily N-acetyltransferase
MSPAGIARAIDWAAAEGWNPGVNDAACFASVDAQGFIGGWLGDRMIASISIVNYDSRFSFLGFYIVEEAYRGQGYGYRLWSDALKHAGNRTVGLDGVTAEQENYRKSGFELAYRNIRYGGHPGKIADIATPAGLEITQLAALNPKLAAFDRRLFPAPREAFLASWLSAPKHGSLCASKDGELVGFGVIRPCRMGYKIGPLFAEDHSVAESLLAKLLSGIEPEREAEVFLDVPEPNPDAAALAEGLGLAPVFETARMYKGPAPDLDTTRFFASPL